MTGSELLGDVITSAATLIVGAALLGIWAWIKRRVKVASPASEELEGVKSEQCRQGRVLSVLFRIQKPQLEAQTAILEAIQGDVNGNVTNALKGIRRASATFDDFKDDAVVGECKE